MSSLSRRLSELHDQLAAAAVRGGRAPEAVRLVVVTKSAPPSVFGELLELGVTDCGENRVQGAAERLAGFEQRLRWHFIGRLQSNKVRKALALFDVFHGVDSAGLLGRLDQVAEELGKRPTLLLQVNVSGEDSKAGVSPEELPELLSRAGELRAARVAGLMTMAPRAEDPEQTRPIFRRLAELAFELGPPDAPVPLPELSMGMSQDAAVAVEEGATLVRVGRQLLAPAEVQ